MFSDKKYVALWGQHAEELAALLLMTVLSQSFLSFVRRNLMTLSFFTTRHKNQ